jgi:hypothetical protein
LRYLLGVLLAAILMGCIDEADTQPLSLHDTAVMGDKKYAITLVSDPAKPAGGKPFTLKISLHDANTNAAVKHLTYELEIRDSSGKNVFWDSRHAMEGAAYVEKITLDPGDYTMKVAVDHGMGDKIMRLYEKELRFRVG